MRFFVNDMYQRMEFFSSLDVVKSEAGANGSADKDLLNKEFKEISDTSPTCLIREFVSGAYFECSV